MKEALEGKWRETLEQPSPSSGSVQCRIAPLDFDIRMVSYRNILGNLNLVGSMNTKEEIEGYVFRLIVLEGVPADEVIS